MCGIVGAVRSGAPVTAGLLEGLRVLEYRGYDSAGLATAEGNTLRVAKREGRLANLEAAIAEDCSTIRRAVKAALKNGQLEEIVDEDMLSCWSCDAGDRKLALALLEAFSSSIPWSASASTALDAVLGTDEAKPPSKKKRRSLTNSRTSPKKTPVVKTVSICTC